jgi:hypothetical protein
MMSEVTIKESGHASDGTVMQSSGGNLSISGGSKWPFARILEELEPEAGG